MVRRDDGCEGIDGLKSDNDLWNFINWKEVIQTVNCLQVRIVKAVKAKNREKVRSLQVSADSEDYWPGLLPVGSKPLSK